MPVPFYWCSMMQAPQKKNQNFPALCCDTIQDSPGQGSVNLVFNLFIQSTHRPMLWDIECHFRVHTESSVIAWLGRPARGLANCQCHREKKMVPSFAPVNNISVCMSVTWQSLSQAISSFPSFRHSTVGPRSLEYTSTPWIKFSAFHLWVKF